MTPQAEKIFHYPMDHNRKGLVREMMAGAQFFDCDALMPIIELRTSMPGDWKCSDEILQCELPSEKTWIDAADHSISLSREVKGEIAKNGGVIDMLGILFQFSKADVLHTCEFMFFDDGSIGVTGDNSAEKIEICQQAINTAWYCIEAMQTQGGLCHGIDRDATRQQKRAAQRSGNPCHKWVEIRLGRARTRSEGCGSGKSKMIAWHYRRGHRINHPNPNFPKWRKGCWVGDTDAGIRTHNYIVEVPS